MEDIVFMNNTVIDDESVFEFIREVLRHGVKDEWVYLTHTGDYIVNGSPYPDWITWEKENEIAKYDYNMDNLESCREEIKKEIQERFINEKLEWMKDCNFTNEMLEFLDLLHQQFLAIERYTNNPDDKEAVEIIRDTYSKTNKNALEYLRQVKTPKEWMDLGDFKGKQLCTVMTGYDYNTKIIGKIDLFDSFEPFEPMYNKVPDFEIVSTNKEVSQILNKMYFLYIKASRDIDDICEDLINEKRSHK